MKKLINEFYRLYKSPIIRTTVIFKTLIHILKSKFMNIYFEYYPTILFHSRHSPVENNLVISLTSFPKRIKNTHRAIKSILRQSIQPENLILWLTYAEFSKNPKIPHKLLKLEKFGLQIKFVDENFGPHNKYIHTLKNYSDWTIITFDDDVLYPKDIVKNLIQGYKNSTEKKIIISSQTRTINFNNDGSASNYSEWPHTKERLISKKLVHLSVYGVLFPAKSITLPADKQFSFKNTSIGNDDFWLKFVTLSNDYKIFNLALGTDRFLTVNNSQKVSLASENVGNNRNDYYFDNLIKQFKFSYKNFED